MVLFLLLIGLSDIQTPEGRGNMFLGVIGLLTYGFFLIVVLFMQLRKDAKTDDITKAKIDSEE